MRSQGSPSWKSLLIVVVLALLTGASSAQAAPLNLTLDPPPDIFSAFITVSYDAGTDLFTASGFALELDDDGVGPPEPIVGGTFDIVATINGSGTLVGGTLVIGGTVPTLGFVSGTLLTGLLTALGFPDSGGDPLEFLFTVIAGDAAALYGGPGAVGGIIMSGTGFPATLWGADFNNVDPEFGFGLGFADVTPVRQQQEFIPEPTSLFLGLACGVGLLMVWRRRGRDGLSSSFRATT